MIMKTEMKELDLNEMEQVDAGCFWCLGYVVVVAAAGYGIGRLIAHNAKNGK